MKTGQLHWGSWHHTFTHFTHFSTYTGMFNHVASKGNTKCLFPILQCTSFTSNTSDLATSFSQTSASNTSCKDNHVTIKQNSRLIQTKIYLRPERKIDTPDFRPLKLVYGSKYDHSWSEMASICVLNIWEGLRICQSWCNTMLLVSYEHAKYPM